MLRERDGERRKETERGMEQENCPKREDDGELCNEGERDRKRGIEAYIDVQTRGELELHG